jgi:hypothetical protein
MKAVKTWWHPPLSGGSKTRPPPWCVVRPQSALAGDRAPAAFKRVVSGAGVRGLCHLDCPSGHVVYKLHLLEVRHVGDTVEFTMRQVGTR